MVRATVNKWSISLLKSTDNNIFVSERWEGWLPGPNLPLPCGNHFWKLNISWAGWQQHQKPLAGFPFKMPSEKLSGILRHVTLRSRASPDWHCQPCTGTKPLQLPCPWSTCPLRTPLLTSLSGIWVQKTQMQTTCFSTRLNKLLIVLWDIGVVCWPRFLSD